jgi:chromosomal replication initiation ATPase DnaA
MKANPWAQNAAAAHLAMGVAAYGLDVPIDAIESDVRGPAQAAFARQVAMYLCHVAFELSLSRVGIAFRRDRSTVAHACHTIEDRREDAAFDDWIASLEAMLQRAPAPNPSMWRAAQP